MLTEPEAWLSAISLMQLAPPGPQHSGGAFFSRGASPPDQLSAYSKCAGRLPGSRATTLRGYVRRSNCPAVAPAFGGAFLLEAALPVTEKRLPPLGDGEGRLDGIRKAAPGRAAAV
jgi:hypothetical protein